VTNGGSSRSLDVVIVGGGHNGLVAAAFLAKAGLNTLVLERREAVGGAVETSEIEPGVRVPTVAHTVGRLRGDVYNTLRLRDHGLRLVQPDVRVFAPAEDGNGITLWGDPARTAAELRSRSTHDADAYVDFDRSLQALAAFLGRLLPLTPPDLRSPSLADAIGGLQAGLSFRGLGRREGHELLRVLPMPVADYVDERFETDALKGALASRGIQYTAMGPRSPGTTSVLLIDSAGNGGAAPGQSIFARGGPGALSQALANAARGFGARLRTGVEVARILSNDGSVKGVALSDGEEIAATFVVSAVDPKRTLLGLLDPAALGPEIAWRAGNFRMPGSVAKVNLVLGAVPRFRGMDGDADGRLRGRIVMAPGIDALERAFDASKYGRLSEQPYLEATIPSLVDPSLAPDGDAGRPGGRHVMSVLVQYAPYHLREGSWDERRDALGDLVLRTLDGYAPGLSSTVTTRQVLTPLDLERDYGLTEGHPYHGEPGLDQLFAWRPLLGHARYRMPLRGLYLSGAGAHPGGGVTGGPGANAAREILSDWKRRR
jgi:phytoene dehydrogenase-like protein